MRQALNRQFRTPDPLKKLLLIPNVDKDSDEDGSVAYTSAGGAFDGDEVLFENSDTQTNRIYLCNKLADEEELEQVSTVVHELAHYVSGRPLEIDDIITGSMTNPNKAPRFMALRPEQKIISAEHYAFFALLCAGSGRLKAVQTAGF